MTPEHYLGIISLIIGLYLLYILNPINIDPFLREEADRCLNHKCEADEDWNSQGRVYSEGLALIEKDGKKKFINQRKLADSGLLHQ